MQTGEARSYWVCIPHSTATAGIRGTTEQLRRAREFTLFSSSNPSTRISATFSIAFKAFFIFHFSVISAKMANATDADQ